MKRLPPVPAGLDVAVGVTICTTRAPLAVPAATATCVVAAVPSALTTTSSTVNAGSGTLSRRKTMELAPLRPCPAIVSASVAPAVVVAGVTARTTGSFATDTAPLTVSVAARGAAASTLTDAPTLRSSVTGGAAVATLTGRDASNKPNAGTMVTIADAVSFASSRCVALIVTVGGTGIRLGAVYSPSALIVPRIGSPPVRPLTAQRTALSVAVNGRRPSIRTEAISGAMARRPRTRNTRWDFAEPIGVATLSGPVVAAGGTLAMSRLGAAATISAAWPSKDRKF